MEREYEADQATEAAKALLSLDQAKAEEETEPEPIVSNKRNRGSLKSEGGVSYNKPQPKSKNPGTWTAAWKCFRKSGFNTKQQADAKLAYWKDNDLCPCCEKPQEAQNGPPTTEYRFKCSDPTADLIAVINGKEYRIPGGGEYVIKL